MINEIDSTIGNIVDIARTTDEENEHEVFNEVNHLRNLIKTLQQNKYNEGLVDGIKHGMKALVEVINSEREQNDKKRNEETVEKIS